MFYLWAQDPSTDYSTVCITTLSNIIKQGIIRFKTLSNSNHILNNYSEKFSQYVSFQGIFRLKCKIVSYCSLYSTELDAINVF